MASIKCVLKKEKIVNGLAPIYIRVTKNRKSNFLSTDIKLKPSDWNFETSKVKKSHPNSNRMNLMISKWLGSIESHALELETKDKKTSSLAIKQKVIGGQSLNFFEFSSLVLKQYDKNQMFGTFDKAKSILNKINTFNKSKNLTFQEITPAFLEKYSDFCRLKFKNKLNTIAKDMKFIKKVFNEALSEGIIEYKESPFLKYKIKLEKTHRIYLTEDELMKFKNAPCQAGSKIDIYKDMFVFASYAGGIRISDILLIKWQNINDSHLNFIIKKTKTQISVKLPDIAIEIINKYLNANTTNDSYVFPVLNNNLDENNLREVDRVISGATAIVNKNLKIISKLAEIDKNISFHLSRHTFATRALTKGISIDKVSKLLGHSSIKETQIYAKIINTELDKAMDVFNE